MDIIIGVLTSFKSLIVEYGLIVALIAGIVALGIGGCYSTSKTLKAHKKRDLDRRLQVISGEGGEEETGVAWVKILNEYRNNIANANRSKE